ncbi:hypothetical protein ACHAW5_000272 [Stephanodiscus triporus]|uniref:Eukaryotic translation initiation factor 1A domain-containing protein n=1 Tax=Stephanodiscus triporus TaxID=2934178 RepID=A0ABD3MMJ5_9STRA
MAGSGRRSHYRKHLTDAVLHDLPEPDEGSGRRIALVVGTRGGNMFDVVVAMPPTAAPAPAPPTTTTTTTTRTTSVTNDVLASASASDDDDDDDDDGRRSGEDGGGGGGGGATSIIPSPPPPPPPPTRDVPPRSSQLAFLPAKFRRLIWIKRNDYVIVECGDGGGDFAGNARRGDGKSEGRDQSSSSSSSSGGGGGFRYVITNILYKDQVKHIKSRGLWPSSDPFFADEDCPMPPVVAVSTAGGGVTRRKSDRRIGATTATDDSRPDDDDDDDDDDYCDAHNDRDGAYEEDGIVFDDPLGEELALNTNRAAALRVEDSSSSSEEEEEEDGD